MVSPIGFFFIAILIHGFRLSFCLWFLTVFFFVILFIVLGFLLCISITLLLIILTFTMTTQNNDISYVRFLVHLFSCFIYKFAKSKMFPFPTIVHCVLYYFEIIHSDLWDILLLILIINILSHLLIIIVFLFRYIFFAFEVFYMFKKFMSYVKTQF